MTAVNSTMLELGTKAPPFRLPSATGSTVSVGDFSDASALLVMFICNHCPFVKHVRDEPAKLANDYRPRGVAVVAVNSNDWSTYPDDSPEMMEKEKTATPRRSPRLEMKKVQVVEKKRVRRSPRLRKVEDEEGLERRNLSPLQSPVSKMRKMPPK